MRYRTAYPNELCHYGVLGMHWGVRRYQNYDGTRIASGSPPVKNPNSLKGGSQRLHLGTGEVQRAKAGGFKNTIVGGQGGKAKGTARLAAKAPSMTENKKDKEQEKEKSPNVKEMFRDIGNAAEGAGKIADHAKKRDKKVREANEKQRKQRQKEAKQMSDKELRDSINRIKMEREYESLTTKEVETGYDKFKEVMSEVRDVAITAAAVAGLVLTIIKIKKSLSLAQSEMTDDQRNELNSFIEIGDYDDEFIAHAMDLDLDYVIDYFDLSDDFLAHYGVLGQKWGVRRYQNYDGTRIGTGSGVGGGKGGGLNRNLRAANASQRDADDLRKHGYIKEADAVQKVADKQRAKGEAKLRKKFDTSRLAASPFGAKKSKIRSDGKDESTFTHEQRRTSQDARKDAEEFARAKAFYGEGAGNRRKVIKTTVEAKKKKDKFYAEEFEYHLSQQDMEYHMEKAKGERRNKDAQKSAKSAARKLESGLRFASRFF